MSSTTIDATRIMAAKAGGSKTTPTTAGP